MDDSGGGGDDSVRFTALYRSHHRDVYAYVRRRVDPAAVDDVVAEVFLAAWRHLDRALVAPLPWLYATAGHAVSNSRRAAVRRGRLAGRLGGLLPSAPDCVWPSGAGDDQLAAALDRLPVRDREVLLLTCWEDLDLAATAATLGCSVGAAKVRLHRARRRLQHLLTAGASEQSPCDPYAQLRTDQEVL